MTDRRRRLAGRYRLDGSLGRGGMSEVFHGYDERLDRRVAIKLLRLAARRCSATLPTPLRLNAVWEQPSPAGDSGSSRQRIQASRS
ncbi:MAG: hypothetical protein ACRDTJ_17680 [Pseudonocardiaceae bacterium]